MPKAHRMYRRRVRDIWRWEAWRHRAPGLTERDYQAMCNFASYVSFETIAAYFGCSEAHVEEEVVFTNAFYGFQRRMKVSTWHPGRGDALKRSEEHTSELQSRQYLVCRLLLEKKKQTNIQK